MIRSMTAYARSEIKQKGWSATWELRSVNQRYLETFVRLPEQFRSLEPIIRESLRMRLTRGKVECQLRFEWESDSATELVLNTELANQLINSANWIRQQSQSGEINPVDILRWPGVMSAKEQDLDVITTQLMAALDETIEKQFIEVREAEGKALHQMIEQRLDGVMVEVEKVRKLMPEILTWQRNKLLTKFEEVQLRVDQDRLEQELLLMAQRIDVAEELDRLTAHVAETYKILNRKEAVGRRLDFMMQEFNREANTLASKSISQEVTTSAVELKVLIEQMREQIQNIE